LTILTQSAFLVVQDTVGSHSRCLRATLGGIKLATGTRMRL
jgi:hypothetical protein